MAPRKTINRGDATIEEAKKATVMKAAKRPARGYHKFRNGLLNVTPKGDERELVQENEKSPLLRLPPEIRNSIWANTLGGKTYRAEQISFRPRNVRFRASPIESRNAMALLRVCRQTYAEAALMPFRLNIFALHHVFLLRDSLKKLKPYQRRQITSLRIELTEMDPLWERYEGVYFESLVSKMLPEVKSLNVCVFRPGSPEETVLDLEDVRRRFEQNMVRNASMEVVVEDMGVDWASYIASFKGVASESKLATSQADE